MGRKICARTVEFLHDIDTGRFHFIMERIAPAYAHNLPGLFSLECWGGAMFDVAMRFALERTGPSSAPSDAARRRAAGRLARQLSGWHSQLAQTLPDGRVPDTPLGRSCRGPGRTRAALAPAGHGNRRCALSR